jgi:hypothetical protein
MTLRDLYIHLPIPFLVGKKETNHIEEVLNLQTIISWQIHHLGQLKHFPFEINFSKQ